MATLSNLQCPKAGCLHAGILLAFGLMFAALGIQSMAGLSEALQWHRSQFEGLTWFTSHLCHWSWEHLLWDVAAFALLSFLSLRIQPSRYAPTLLIAALLIPLEIQFFQLHLNSYRGLSGLDCALFGLVIAALWRHEPGQEKNRPARGLALTATIGFLAKSIYEQSTGSTIFVASNEALFVPVPSAHLIGFVTGVTTGIIEPKPLIRSISSALARNRTWICGFGDHHSIR